MTTLTTTDDYKEAYEIASKLPQMSDIHEAEHFASLIPIQGRLKILDIGCAEGTLLMVLKQKGHIVKGIDISTKWVNIVREKDIHAEVLDIQSEHLDEKFDVIYLLDVIEHFQNPIQALVHTRKMLSDNGCLIINTPNAMNLKRVFYVYVHRRWKTKFNALHITLWDTVSLRMLLNYAGFEVYNSLHRNWSKQITFICKKTTPLDIKTVLGLDDSDYNNNDKIKEQKEVKK